MPALLNYVVGLILFWVLMFIFAFIFAECIKNKIFKIIFSILAVACFFIGLSAMLASSTIIKPIRLQKVNSVENIVCLNNNNIARGKIYYRHGYIEQTQYYQYMVDLGNGQYIQNQVPSNETYVSYISKDDTTSKPRVEWLTKRKQFFIFYNDETYWKLYVPEGTISEGFNIDLK